MIHRREFVRWSAAGLVAGRMSVPALHRDDRIRGANDRIAVALIGSGRQGVTDLKSAMRHPDVDAVAVCDVYRPNLAKGAEAAPKAQQYADFRRVLDHKDIDVVIVASPDHWHPLHTILACEAGKDVYVEKPISVAIDEGRKMVEAARRYQRVVQVGTQQRSGKHFQQAAELVKGGRIGQVTQVRCWNVSNEFPEGIGSPPDSAPPQDLDWDMWLGPAQERPFNANRFGVAPDRWSSFRWFWDYAGGMMTDWGVHWLDIVQMATGANAPTSISTMGGKSALQDNRETPDTIIASYQYPGFICTYENRLANGAPLNGKNGGILFYGTDGTLFIDRQGFEIVPELRKLDSVTVDRSAPMKVNNSNNNHQDHLLDFIDCVKTRATPRSDIEIGHRSTSTALLGNIAYRSGHRIEWDAKNERILGDRDASRYLTREYRKPWKI